MSACPWSALGVARGAPPAAVKAAYKAAALRYHPDRHAAAGEEAAALAAERFKAVSEAYEAIRGGKGHARAGAGAGARARARWSAEEQRAWDQRAGWARRQQASYERWRARQRGARVRARAQRTHTCV